MIGIALPPVLPDRAGGDGWVTVVAIVAFAVAWIAFAWVFIRSRVRHEEVREEVRYREAA